MCTFLFCWKSWCSHKIMSLNLIYNKMLKTPVNPFLVFWPKINPSIILSASLCLTVLGTLQYGKKSKSWNFTPNYKKLPFKKKNKLTPHSKHILFCTRNEIAQACQYTPVYQGCTYDAGSGTHFLAGMHQMTRWDCLYETAELQVFLSPPLKKKSIYIL